MSYYIVEIAGELPTYGALAKAKKLEDAEVKLLEYVRKNECYILPKDELLKLRLEDGQRIDWSDNND